LLGVYEVDSFIQLIGNTSYYYPVVIAKT